MKDVASQCIGNERKEEKITLMKRKEERKIERSGMAVYNERKEESITNGKKGKKEKLKEVACQCMMKEKKKR